MIKQILYKWFGLSDTPCETCEVLKESLNIERQFNKVLLNRLLDKDKTEPPPEIQQTFTPIQPAFVPWRVRQQMMEAEDRKKAELLKQRNKEIKDLELELGVSDAVSDPGIPSVSSGNRNSTVDSPDVLPGPSLAGKGNHHHFGT